MTDQSGVGLPPATMRCFLGLVVMLAALQVAASFSCPKVLNQDLIADPSDCRKYYHCLTDGRYFIKSCPHGLVFEPKNKVCMWDSSRSCAPQLSSDNVIASVAKLAATSTSKATPKKASSTTSEKPTTTTKATQSTTKQTTSAVKTTVKAAPETKAPQVKVVENDAKSTVKSAEPESTTADFSTGTSSENVTGTSNTTDMRAGENPTSGESNETSTEATEVVSTASFKTIAKKTVPKHSVLKRSPFVDDNRIDGDGPKVTCTGAFSYVTDPENCHTFYHCNNWRPFQKRCPPGLFFDSQNLVCNWPHNVNCIEGYRAKSLYTYQNFRRVVRPQPNIQKIKIVESTTEKIPFLETIENDVRKVRYEEDSDSTTAQVRPWYRFERRTTMAPETTSIDELTTEATSTTTESTTTTTTEPSTTSLPPSTSTDTYYYETRPSESRSTWKDWNFDLFYTNSDKQDSDLDKLELFSNGKKVQPVEDDQDMSTDNSEMKSPTSASVPASSTTDAPSTTEESKSNLNEDTTKGAATSTDAESTTNSQTTSESSSTTVQDTDEETTTASAASTSSEPKSTDMVSSDFDAKTSEQPDDETTEVPSASTRATSLDFGSDLDRELKHPRKLQHDGLPPSNPFMTSDRIAANQQSMYARDYTNVEDVEIEKFMMKMLNDAMESKHMVARQASEEYPDNLVEGGIQKKAKESEMGESDALDKWAIADVEGKKTKGTLIDENVETDEVEASGEIENFAADTENHITNLILKDEAKPKSTGKSDNVSETTTPATENKTEAAVTDEPKADNKTADTTVTANNTTTTVTTTTAAETTTRTEVNATTTVGTTTSADTTIKTEVNATTTEATETTKAPATTTTDNATTSIKAEETTTTVAPSTDNVTVKAVPLLKDVSDICSDKNNCSTKTENNNDESTKNKTVTTKAEEPTTTTTVSTTTKTATNATTEAKTTTVKADNTTTTTTTATTVNETEATGMPKADNKTETAEAVTTTAAELEVETTTELPIAKDAAVKYGNEFMASSGNEINKEDKSTLNIENRPLIENATKSEAVNTTETQEEIIPETTSSVNASVSTGSDVDETTSSEESSEDDVKSEITSTISLADTTSLEAKVLNGESKGTTKKSFISLSDLIKWYLRHWRHYSRWRDSKEVKPTPQ